jgi:hypothetical protein
MRICTQVLKFGKQMETSAAVHSDAINVGGDSGGGEG